MLDNVGGGGVRKKIVRRSAANRAAIVAESYEPGATVAMVACDIFELLIVLFERIIGASE